MFSPMYSSSFILLDFTFRPIIHFVLILFLQSFCLHLLKSLSFLHWIAFAPLLKMNWPYMCELVDSLVCSLDLFDCLYTTTTVSWWLTFYNNSWNHIILVLQLCNFLVMSSIFSHNFLLLPFLLFGLLSLEWHTQTFIT